MGLQDILETQLEVIFCGINPGMLAAQQGHHFAGRGNRFWRTLHLAGVTPHELQPQQDRTLLQYGCGLTAVVERATARADQLSRDELLSAATAFEQKIARHGPRFVAFLGKAAYAALSGQREVAWGLQSTAFGNAAVWVLPNPSGRNRAFTAQQLVTAYRELWSAVQAGPAR